MKGNEQKIRELKERLSKKDTSVLLQTLKEVKTEGNYSLIPYLINVFKDIKNQDVRRRIEDILNNLNMQASVPYLVDSIENTEEKEILSVLISSCWKNGLDYSEHIDVFIKKFIAHDFDIALEAFTVIENATTNVEIAEVDKMIKYLKSNIGKVSEDKKALMVELVYMLERRKTE